MKDSEFIQLLNLYLDHEISAPDAARLEAEVQTNAARRKIYQEYCRMQKACRLLSAEFETAPATEKKVVAFRSGQAFSGGRSRTSVGYMLGTFAAAAACVAVVWVNRSPSPGATGNAPVEQPVQIAVSEVAAPASAEKAPALMAVAHPATGPRALGNASRQPPLVANSLLLTGSTQSEAMLAAAIEQADAQLAWMHQIHLSPIQPLAPSNNLRFDPAPASLRPEGRALGNRASAADAQVEMAAFQFQK